MWRLQPADLQRIIDEQNPWHISQVVPSALAYEIERPLGSHLWRSLLNDRPRRFQFVLGPRRVGKTTVLYQTVRHLLASGISPEQIYWLRLDHPVLCQESLGDLVRLIIEMSNATTAAPTYLMLDELVYATRWDLWLKAFYDDRWPVRIAATSSATTALRDRRSESGVGRWEEHRLTPYTFSEYLDVIGSPCEVIVGESLAESLAMMPAGLRTDETLDRHRRSVMFTGGFPELVGALGDDPEPDDASRLFSSQRTLRSDAVERAVYKDIPQSFGVNDPMMLERLLYVLAAQITEIVSITNICSELGLSQPTFNRYLSYLQQAFLVFTLPNYSGREKNVQKRGRKLYFVDAAIRNAALHRGLKPLDDPVEFGALIENMAAASLHSLALQSGVRLHHWRDGRYEVDLIYDHPSEPLAFEIGSSPNHSRSGLAALIERHPHFDGRCYLVTPQSIASPLSLNPSGVGTLPFDHFLVAVGAQTELALLKLLNATSSATSPSIIAP